MKLHTGAFFVTGLEKLSLNIIDLTMVQNVYVLQVLSEHFRGIELVTESYYTYSAKNATNSNVHRGLSRLRKK